MQILNRKYDWHAAVFIAATLSMSQTLDASAHGGYHLGNSNSIIAGISSPTAQDNVLYRPRWSLPSNGTLKKIPLNDDDSGDDNTESTEKKNVEPKAEATVKTTSTRKPAISRSERLNLDSNQTAGDKEDTEVIRKDKTVSTDVKPGAKSTAAQVKRSAPAVVPQLAPAIQSSPTPTPAISAPIPGI